MQPNLRFWYFLRIPVSPNPQNQAPTQRLSPFTQHSNAVRLDIERMYGQRKPIAQRTPLIPSNISRSSSPSIPPTRPKPLSKTDPDLSTPGATESGTSDSDTELETEVDESYAPSPKTPNVKPLHQPIMTLHDLMNFYFRKDALGLHNLDLFRYCNASKQ